jgi:RNA polymerase sigma-70 factor (ECF subfamily)
MDDEILQWVREGRRDDAIARLLPAYRERVFALCLSLVGNRAAAEDIAQEVFVKIWRALPAFDGRSALSTWIYTITRNAALSALRSRRASGSLTEPAVLAEVEARSVEASGAGATDYGAIEADTDARRIEGWVARLPEKQRTVVRLFYLRECSVEEVAELSGMPVGTVKTLLHRGRERLRELAGVT